MVCRNPRSRSGTRKSPGRPGTRRREVGSSHLHRTPKQHQEQDSLRSDPRGRIVGICQRDLPTASRCGVLSHGAFNCGIMWHTMSPKSGPTRQGSSVLALHCPRWTEEHLCQATESVSVRVSSTVAADRSGHAVGLPRGNPRRATAAQWT